MNMSFTRNQKHSSAYGEILAQKKIMNKACKGVIVDLRQLSNFSAISWREQANFNEMIIRSALF
jgi:hypothetical protein